MRKEQKQGLTLKKKHTQGAKGICWLLAAAGSEIDSGAFYLDCASQDKHLDGFLSSSSHTENTPKEVRSFLRSLEKMATAL